MTNKALAFAIILASLIVAAGEVASRMAGPGRYQLSTDGSYRLDTWTGELEQYQLVNEQTGDGAKVRAEWVSPAVVRERRLRSGPAEGRTGSEAADTHKSAWDEAWEKAEAERQK